MAKQLRETYPDLSSDNLYHVAFASHTKTVNANPHTVHVYATTQEELEGIIGSSLVHVANKNKNGYELIENLCNKFGTIIEIIDNTEKTEQQELVEDLVQIVTVFSCRLQGKRANKAKKMIKE